MQEIIDNGDLRRYRTELPNMCDADLTAADVQALKPMPLADDAVIVMTQAEDKTMSLKRLIGVFSHTMAEFDVYGELTGHHVETLPAKRELEKLIKRLERECALLNGQPVEVWGETETVA